ncbi:MAG: hypothetical protein AAGU05_04205, partial [Anaerolineaceae bacterium]
MTAILPLLTLIALFWIFRKKFPHFDLRLAVLLSAAVWGLLLVLITEIASLFHALNYRTLSAVWAFCTGALGVAAFYRWKKIEFKPLRFTVLQWVQIAGIAGISAATLAIAVIAAPNNWDSMVYHLSRVAHWVQNQSVAHYPTSILWQ